MNDKLTQRPLLLAAAALGATTILNPGIADPVLSPEHWKLYHWSSPLYLLFVPTLLDFCLPWLLLTLLLLATQRPGRLRVIVWSAMVCAIPVSLVRYLASVREWHLPHTLMLALAILSLAAFLTAAVGWRPRLEPEFERAQNFAVVVLCFGALSGAATLCEVGWAAWEARSIHSYAEVRPHPSAAPLPAGKPRIFWIVLDELSYQQAYASPVQLELPAFAALAAQASVFTHTVPAGAMTQLVLPSLLNGLPLDGVRSNAKGQLLMHPAHAGAWQPFDQHATVFQDAIAAGYTTAIAGWFNPYCRLFSDLLDRCFWRYGEADRTGGMLPYASVTSNMVGQYRAKYHSIDYIINKVARIPGWDDQYPKVHEGDYLTLRTEADKLLADPTCNFVLLHLPIPHPPGIYNRATSSLSPHNSSYIDNLALADKYLAHVRSVLTQNGEWDSSAILIMGDHSWRTTLLWSSDPSWTPEDQLSSRGGQFDDRPAYIVKLPHQHQGTRIDSPYAAVNTRALLDAIMASQIVTPDQLGAWVASRPAPAAAPSRTTPSLRAATP